MNEMIPKIDYARISSVDNGSPDYMATFLAIVGLSLYPDKDKQLH